VVNKLKDHENLNVILMNDRQMNVYAYQEKLEVIIQMIQFHLFYDFLLLH